MLGTNVTTAIIIITATLDILNSSVFCSIIDQIVLNNLQL